MTIISLNQWLLIIGALVSLLGLAGSALYALIRLIVIGQDLRTTLNLIATNDLPHIKDEISELRQQLFNHLIGEGK